MILKYRYSDIFLVEDKAFLTSKGITVRKGLDVFEIKNTSPFFKEIKNYFTDWEDNTLCEIIYSEKELNIVGEASIL
ncbi:hypothetical protein L5B71_03300 [Avibacterium sp. 21-586]|uniref:hypothetical protein n=1 Tax=Avibacterium sp. 21-586 TaxID=2911534 RepID=UPI002245A887|nr:hypothetical protein [Avibacterium sp. 21-586]MCW9709918.1 hypothetical protein [Avibacterium sp. 21-586]